MNRFNQFLLAINISFAPLYAWGIPLDDLHQNEELLIESSDASVLPYQLLRREEKPILSPKNEVSSDVISTQPFIQESSLKERRGINDSLKDKQFIGSEDTEFYLFEQEELDAQKPGLGIYETLAPILSSEMKKDAKKAWAETADFRATIDFSTMESESQELVLKKSSSEMTELKGKTLEEISNKNLPPGGYDDKEPDKAMVRDLFDRFYDLLKNAFLIIAGVLISGKIISFIVINVIADREKRKKRHARRRHSKRHRKKRRRTYA